MPKQLSLSECHSPMERSRAVLQVVHGDIIPPGVRGAAAFVREARERGIEPEIVHRRVRMTWPLLSLIEVLREVAK